MPFSDVPASPQAAVASAPVPASVPPALLTRAEIQAAERERQGPGPSLALVRLVRKHQSPAVQPARWFGMTAFEDFHSLTFEGIRFHFPPLAGPADPILRQLSVLAQVPPLPPGLVRYTTDVYLSRQSSAEDRYWAGVYQNPWFRSASSAGGGKMVIYSGRYQEAGWFAHELGHNLAVGVYGDGSPPRGSAYRAAIESGEPPVSEYAGTSPPEDFAESVRWYCWNRSRLAAIAPKRHAALKELIDAVPS